MVQSLALIFPILMIAAAVTDVRAYRIPNWLSGLTAALFFPVAMIAGFSMYDLLMHASAGLLLLVICFVLFQFGIMGGGDAKLIAAAGLWFGLSDSGYFIQVTAMCGGALALAMMVWSIFKYAVQLDLGDLIPAIRKVSPKLPYGIALAAGAIIAYPQSSWMTGLVN
jgi:prepilin peptidase CpaA